MNSNVDHSKFSDIFGDGEQSGDDVSLESALKASQMTPKQVEKVKVFDTELGGTIVEVEFDGGMVDEVSAEYCEKIS